MVYCYMTASQVASTDSVIEALAGEKYNVAWYNTSVTGQHGITTYIAGYTPPDTHSMATGHCTKSTNPIMHE